MKVRFALLLVIWLLIHPAGIRAQENFAELLKQATLLSDQGKFEQAIGKLNAAIKQLEQLHAAKLAECLPAKVGDFIGDEPSISSALGLVSIERTYRNPGGAALKISLAGASTGDSGIGAGLGGLAGLAQMAGSLKNLPGIETVRVKGHTATLQTEAGRKAQLMLAAEGYILQVEARQGTIPKEALIAAAEAVDWQRLSSYTAE